MKEYLFTRNGLHEFKVSESIANICIIVGHSNEDGGAESIDNGLSEYVYNYPVAFQVARHLNTMKISCDIYTREYQQQWPNMCRDWINKREYDLVVMLHLNSFNSKAYGTEVLYWHTSNNGKIAASAMQHNIDELFDSGDRGIKPLKYGDRAWYLVYRPTAPAIIIEALFIDNPNDEALLKKYHDLYDEAVVSGIIDYLEWRDIEIE